MKKKFLLALAIVAIMTCLFAISVSADANPNYNDAYVEKMTSGMTSVTLVDGTTVCPLYDADGYALCYYDLGTGLQSVRAEDLVITKDGTKLHSIALSDGTVLVTKTSSKTNKLVVLNLRHTDITDFVHDNLFKQQTVLQYIFMPDTIEKLLNYVFYENTNLIGCYFSETSNLTDLRCQTFFKCTSLKGFYMPSKIVNVGLTTSNGTNNTSAFTNCSSMWFINDYSKDPTSSESKPSVYYFPDTLVTVATECFKGCSNLNETLVFPVGVTSIPSNGWTFANFNSVKNLVFLGNVTEFKSSKDTKNLNIYLANKETKKTTVNFTFDKDSIGSNNTVYFCAEGIKAPLTTNWASNLVDMDVANDHLYLKQVSTLPTCTEPGVTGITCFCGLPKEGSSTTVPASGHKAGDTIIKKYFTVNEDGSINYFANMVKVCACTVCSVEAEFEMEDTALFATDKGYSFSETDKSSISYTLHVNLEAMKAYLAENAGFKYGIVVSANPSEAPITYADNTISHDAKTLVFEMQGTTYMYEYVMAKLTLDTDYQAKELHCQAYAIENNTITYVGQNSVSASAEVISHAILVEKYGKKDETQA